MNTIGSYQCECRNGFKKQSGTDDKLCVDVNECADIPGLCSQRCINYWGSYRCACDTGYRLSDNNRTCEDIDECEMHKTYNLCLGLCENTQGSYQCVCPLGYRLGLLTRPIGWPYFLPIRIDSVEMYEIQVFRRFRAKRYRS